MAIPRSLLPLTFVFLVIVVHAANSSRTPNSNNSGVRRPTVSKCHSTYTYNSNFYAGLNKKVENLLGEVKHELKEMNGNPKLCKGSNKTIEGLFPEIKNELGEIKKEIKSLKENITADTVNNEIKTLLDGVVNELREMRNEIKSLKENKTIGQESNTSVTGLLREIKLELSKLGHGTKCSKVYKSCSELYKAGKRTSGVYTINPDNGGAFDVYCDQTTAGGGWTVIQKRLDGSVNFYRGWYDYKRGFGNIRGEFWLGLDKIHRLTNKRSKLRVDLKDWSGNTAYAEYSSFGVDDEGNKYKLSLGSYSGTAGDSLSYHRGMAFTTRDRDNDSYGRNCATQFKGAWWYNSGCHYSNLNGRYLKGKHSSLADGVNWYHWKGFYYSVKQAEMKIKSVQ